MLIVNGESSPKGSNTFADSFSTERFVVGRDLAQASKSEVSHCSSSVRTFQLSPRIFVQQFPFDDGVSNLIFCELLSSAVTLGSQFALFEGRFTSADLEFREVERVFSDSILSLSSLELYSTFAG